MQKTIAVLIILSITVPIYAGGSFDTIVFNRIAEPEENAFTILVPMGWVIESDIIRGDSIPGDNAIEGKFDFAVKSDSNGTVMIRWLPDMINYTIAHPVLDTLMGLYPSPEHNNKIIDRPYMAAVDFLGLDLLLYLHEQSTNLSADYMKRLENVADNYQKRVNTYLPGMRYSYDAGYVLASYNEEGVKYKEALFTVVENHQQKGNGIWGNRECFFFRAPFNEFERWKLVFSVIQNSMQINIQWLADEIQGQIKRGEIAAKTQVEIDTIACGITSNTNQTMAEIQHEIYLNIIDQEEYVNPYTNEIETGSNHWAHRWQNESGDIIYTNQEGYDPNTDIKINRSDFKRSWIRERGPK